MSNWLPLIDRAILARQRSGEPPVFSTEDLSQRLSSVLDPDEVDAKTLILMNLCFDALVCIVRLKLGTAKQEAELVLGV